MWRSRRWCGVCAVAVAVVGAVALAWPAVAAGSAAQSDPGTLAVSSSGTVTASVGTILTFTFTAPVPPPTRYVFVTLPMPSGWTAAQPSLSDLDCANSGCTLGTSGGQIEVKMILYDATSFQLAVQVTPPASATSDSFTAVEEWQDPLLARQATSSPVTVICPADGLGTMTVDPTTVAVASGGMFTFTYVAGSCGAGAGGTVGVTVPDGWTSPGPVVASAGDLASGTPITFTYGPAQASAAGPATFAAWQAAAGGPTQDLASPPVVTVTQAQVVTGPPTSPSQSQSPSPSPSLTPTSASPSRAGGGGPTTVTSSEMTVTSSRVTVTPSRVTPANTSTGEQAGQPVALVAYGLGTTGLVLLAGTAGLLAFRSRRRGGRPHRGGHGTGGGNIRAVPHAGPPPSVAVRDTGNRPTLTVRLERHASATVTTIKDQQP